MSDLLDISFESGDSDFLSIEEEIKIFEIMSKIDILESYSTTSQREAALNTVEVLKDYFLAKDFEIFHIKVFIGKEVIIVETPYIYDISREILETLYHRLPSSINLYFKYIPKEYMNTYSCESIRLRLDEYPCLDKTVHLNKVLEAPNSLKFIMED